MSMMLPRAGGRCGCWFGDLGQFALLTSGFWGLGSSGLEGSRDLRFRVFEFYSFTDSCSARPNLTNNSTVVIVMVAIKAIVVAIVVAVVVAVVVVVVVIVTAIVMVVVCVSNHIINNNRKGKSLGVCFPETMGQYNRSNCCDSTKVRQTPMILHLRNSATPFGTRCPRAYCWEVRTRRC